MKTEVKLMMEEKTMTQYVVISDDALGMHNVHIDQVVSIINAADELVRAIDEIPTYLDYTRSDVLRDALEQYRAMRYYNNAV